MIELLVSLALSAVVTWCIVLIVEHQFDTSKKTSRNKGYINPNNQYRYKYPKGSNMKT